MRSQHYIVSSIYFSNDIMHVSSVLFITILNNYKVKMWFASIVAPDQRDEVLAAMRLLENLTSVDDVPCVQFRPKIPEDGEYSIFIYDGDGCNSYVIMR